MRKLLDPVGDVICVLATTMHVRGRVVDKESTVDLLFLWSPELEASGGFEFELVQCRYHVVFLIAI